MYVQVHRVSNLSASINRIERENDERKLHPVISINLEDRDGWLHDLCAL